MNALLKPIFSLAITAVLITLGCGPEDSMNERRHHSEAGEQKAPSPYSGSVGHSDESEFDEIELPQAEYGKPIDKSKAIHVYLRLDDETLRCSVRSLDSKKVISLADDEIQREKDLLEFFNHELQKEKAPEMIVINTGKKVKYIETNKVLDIAKRSMRDSDNEVVVYVAVDDESEK